jgi:hypothetical protein
MRTKITAYARQKSPLIKDAISPVFNLTHNLIQLGPLPNQIRAIFQLKQGDFQKLAHFNAVNC